MKVNRELNRIYRRMNYYNRRKLKEAVRPCPKKRRRKKKKK